MASSLTTVQEFLDSNPDVRFVRFLMADHSSVLRVAAVMPRKATLKVAADDGFNAPVARYLSVITAFETINREGMASGVDWIIPDWATLKVCTLHPAHGMVMCAVREDRTHDDKVKQNGETGENGQKGQKHDGKDDDDAGFDICPRSALVRQVKRAKSIGQEILIGMELEFMLYRPGTDFTRAPATTNYSTWFLHHDDMTRALDDLAQLLEDTGIEVMKYHPEGLGPGLFELVLAPAGALEAADNVIYCREAIKTVAQRHGFEATLSPHPYEKGGVVIGSHTSISISDVSKADAFLSGVLASLPAIGAFAMSSVQSGMRLAGSDSLVDVRWGPNNKTCVVRERRTGLWEFRCPDSTMNPHLAFAAFLAAGVSGIERHAKLAVKPHLKTAIKLTDDEKTELGIVDSIPESIEGRIARLAKDDVLRTALSPRMVDSFISLKKCEIEAAKGLTIREISDRLRVLF
jgi:glutamine synthetase